MKRIVLITIMALVTLSVSAQKVYKASNFGIKSDGIFDNTSAIQGAIDFLSAKGEGDILEFNVGRYLTGAVQLKSGVTIKLREGAVIVGSDNIFNYHGKKAIFWAENQENITITGSGVIDGRGGLLLKDIEKKKGLGILSESVPTPSLLYLKDCKNVLLQNFILRYPATEPELYKIEGGSVKIDGCYSDSQR